MLAFITKDGGSIDLLHYKVGVSDIKCERPMPKQQSYFQARYTYPNENRGRYLNGGYRARFVLAIQITRPSRKV